MAARNLADLVRAAAEATPSRLALVEDERSVDWLELDALVDRAARGLLAGGRSAGDRVGILLPNRIEFVVTYLGTLRAGLVAVPLNTAFTAMELGYQAADAELALVVTDAELSERVQALGAERLVVVDTPAWDELLAAADSDAGQAAALGTAGGEDLALLLYTSGTTGRPRGAMLSHRALLANLEQLDRIEPPVVAPEDRMLLVLPLFHVYGLNAALGMVLRSGATGVLARRFDPVETLATVRRHGVTCIVGAPPMYVAWSLLKDLGDSLASVRLMLSGAAPLPPGIIDRVLEVSGKHVFEGYGLTETAPVLTTTLCSPVPKAGSVGRPLQGVALRIVDDAGDEVEDDDPGEVVVKGDNLFSGYWPDGSGGADPQGWFRTGDVGYADADGDLFLVDRTRELVIVSGFNVYPREVEEALADHPAVEEVAVVGVPHPYTGETVKALVVRRPGAQLTADELIEHAAARLARFKCPTVVEFVDELPHSLAGKVAKGRLREAAASE